MYGINVALKLHSLVNRVYRLIQQCCVVSVKAYTAVYPQWELSHPWYSYTKLPHSATYVAFVNLYLGWQLLISNKPPSCLCHITTTSTCKLYALLLLWLYCCLLIFYWLSMMMLCSIIIIYYYSFWASLLFTCSTNKTSYKISIFIKLFKNIPPSLQCASLPRALWAPPLFFCANKAMKISHDAILCAPSSTCALIDFLLPSAIGSISTF